MSKRTKLWLIIATCLVLVGCIILGGVMAVLKWDWSKLSTTRFVTNEYTISEKFSSIAIDTNTVDLTFAVSSDGVCKVECFENQKEMHTVTIRENTLQITRKNEKAWYDYIGIHFSSPRITIYLPQAEYGKLTIKESTGSIHIPGDFQFENVDIAVSTGDVNCASSVTETLKIEVSTGKTSLTGLTCKNFVTTGSTGEVILKNVIATEAFSIKRSTGDVKLEGCDATEIRIETATGSVRGTLLTDKVFIVQTSTGNVNVPKTAAGGKCEITTGTGDINFSIE